MKEKYRYTEQQEINELLKELRGEKYRLKKWFIMRKLNKVIKEIEEKLTSTGSITGAKLYGFAHLMRSIYEDDAILFPVAYAFVYIYIINRDYYSSNDIVKFVYSDDEYSTSIIVAYDTFTDKFSIKLSSNRKVGDNAESRELELGDDSNISKESDAAYYDITCYIIQICCAMLKHHFKYYPTI